MNVTKGSVKITGSNAVLLVSYVDDTSVDGHYGYATVDWGATRNGAPGNFNTLDVSKYPKKMIRISNTLKTGVTEKSITYSLYAHRAVGIGGNFNTYVGIKTLLNAVALAYGAVIWIDASTLADMNYPWVSFAIRTVWQGAGVPDSGSVDVDVFGGAV